MSSVKCGKISVDEIQQNVTEILSFCLIENDMAEKKFLLFQFDASLIVQAYACCVKHFLLLSWNSIRPDKINWKRFLTYLIFYKLQFYIMEGAMHARKLKMLWHFDNAWIYGVSNTLVGKKIHMKFSHFTSIIFRHLFFLFNSFVWT